MKSKQQRRTEAIERQAQHNSLTTDQKIEKCLNRRGNSAREMNRLDKETTNG